MTADDAPFFTRERVRVLALLALTAAVLYAGYRLTVPLLPALAGALALAVLAHPVAARIERATGRPTLAAAVTVFLATIVLFGPVLLLATQLARDTAAAAGYVQQQLEEKEWREFLGDVPRVGPALADLDARLDLRARLREAAGSIPGHATAVLSGTAAGAAQTALALLFAFYFLRDRRAVLEGVRSALPLPEREAKRLERQVADSLHATVYGTFVSSLAVGASGGVLFYLLGVPAPVFWGAVMTVFGMLPLLGAPMVWVPVAVWLATTGHAANAGIIAAWGVAAAVAGDVMYGWLVGGRMKLHPVPVFVAFLGGLALLGLSGVVLGPALLAVAVGLLDLWHRWLKGGDAAEEKVV